jgi:hypothetical protein
MLSLTRGVQYQTAPARRPTYTTIQAGGLVVEGLTTPWIHLPTAQVQMVTSVQSNSALLTDACLTALRASSGATKRER